MSRALALALILCAAFPAAAAAKDCVRAAAIPTPETLDDAQAATLCLVNIERRKRGLRALRANADLEKAATGHSRDMVKRKYFGHTSPGGRGSKARARAAGYGSSYVVENIAWGAWKTATPRRIVRLWMRSGIHRAAILNGSYREGGAGVADGLPVRRGEVSFDPAETGGSTYTFMFGAR